MAPTEDRATDRTIDPEATASDSPFLQGRNARLYGKPRSQCPYPEGSGERAAWMQAYEEASSPEADEGGEIKRP
ncbi:ribosome modulation factor [Methylobacterium nigriterrae]|uniref:ribosome modulation factor n=1 Tax=Methylobacterium nigriterrae TaxID=3127512 RepID=UPI003013C526